MTIQLGKQWQKKLAALPESGMGAQHVDIILKDGRVLPDLPVFNGEECQTEAVFDPNDIADIRLHQPPTRGRMSNAA